jgi:hypothetical protein
MAEKTKAKSILILCPKQAKDGWYTFLLDEEFKSILTKTYTVMHYEQMGKVKNKVPKLSVDPKAFDLVIIDESHNFGKLGVPTGRSKLLKALCRDLPHIHLSGTAIIESPCSIYSQMAIGKFSPFSQANFYKFHAEYGIPYYIKAAGRQINMYDKFKDKLLDKIAEFSMYVTQEDIGITNKATDKLHYVTLNATTTKLYKELLKHSYIVLPNGKELLADSTMKLRTSLHMIESGIVKIDDEYIELGNTEKIQYILDTFGDTKGLGIMCHFVGERKMLKRYFTKASIYSSTAHAEGVDLSHLENFVILSSDYRGSKFVQRRDRIVNIKGSNTTIVNHILVKGSISEKIYKAVSKKRDFNNETFNNN